MPGFLFTVEKESGGQAVYITAVVSYDALALLALGGSLSAEGSDQVVNKSGPGLCFHQLFVVSVGRDSLIIRYQHL